MLTSTILPIIIIFTGVATLLLWKLEDIIFPPHDHFVRGIAISLIVFFVASIAEAILMLCGV